VICKEGLLTNMSTTTGRPAGRTPGPVRRELRPTVKVLPEHARAHNRSLVLGHLFHAGPSSRADIARSTGLTRVTVSDLVADLLAEGLVGDLGVRTEGRVGKPATLVGLRAADHHVVVLDLTDDEAVHGAVMTLEGQVVTRDHVPTAGATGPAAVALVEELALRLVAAATAPVLGVGIASPGVVDDTGRVLEAPNRGWYDVPLASRLTAVLGAPVHVANDADTRALGEYTFGGADANAMVVTVGQGVGAGMLVDGALVRGRGHAAGEIGHVTVIDADTPDEAPLPCACGRAGCLETVLSAPALRRRTVGAGAQDADEALAAVGRTLGRTLAPVVSALNLAEVLLSGPVDLLDGPLRAAATTTLRERTIPAVGHDLGVRMAALDEDAALAGAAVLVLSGQLGIT